MFFNLNNFTDEEWAMYESLPYDYIEEFIGIEEVEDALYELGFPTALISEHIEHLTKYEAEYVEDYAD